MKSCRYNSETGRIRFRRARFQTPNSVSFLGVTEFCGAKSVSSSRPIICAPKRTHRVFSQNSPSLPQNSVRLSEFTSPKQYSRNSVPPFPNNPPFANPCLGDADHLFCRLHVATGKASCASSTVHPDQLAWPVGTWRAAGIPLQLLRPSTQKNSSGAKNGKRWRQTASQQSSPYRR